MPPTQPQPYYANQPYAPQPGVMSPGEWEEAVKRQRIEQVVPEHQGSGWGGFELRPKNVRFSTQNKGEKVFILLRKHFITNFGWITSNIFYALIPILLYFGSSLLNLRITTIVSERVIIISLLTYYAILATNVMRHLADWFFNMYLVTNERVIDYDFRAFTSKGASESTLDNIEDVKEESIGVLPSFFNYGNVQIFSAADKTAITFNWVPRPTFVRDKITDLSAIVKTGDND